MLVYIKYKKDQAAPTNTNHSFLAYTPQNLDCKGTTREVQTYANLYVSFNDCLSNQGCKKKFPKWNAKLSTHNASKVK